MIAITGNTYPVRVELRSLGGTWNSLTKSWLVPDDKAEMARSLVMGAGHKSYRKPGRYARVQRHGRCEDAPCCGCCE